MAAMSVTCLKPRNYESKCHWEGPAFKVLRGSSTAYSAVHDVLCQTLNAPITDPLASNPLVFTNGKTWAIYASGADGDTRGIAAELTKVGLRGKLHHYC